MDQHTNHGVFTTQQALMHMTRLALDQGVKDGRYQRIHRNVYRWASAPPTQNQQFAAAVVACGKDAVLSHHSAAQLHGFAIRSVPRTVQVTVPPDRRVERPGICVHRPRAKGRDTPVEVNGLVVTSPAQTLLDLAATLSLGDLRAVFERASAKDITIADRVLSLLRRIGMQGRCGWRMLRRIALGWLSRRQRWMPRNRDRSTKTPQPAPPSLLQTPHAPPDAPHPPLRR